MKTEESLKVTVDTAQLMSDMHIDDANLTESMIQQPALYVHYAMICAEAQRQMDKAKITVDLTESKAHEELTNACRSAGEKVVETALAKQIDRHPSCLKAQVKFADAKAIYTVAKEALEAFRQRRDMLVQIGVNSREEMKGEMRIKAVDAESKAKRAAFAERASRVS